MTESTAEDSAGGLARTRWGRGREKSRSSGKLRPKSSVRLQALQSRDEVCLVVLKLRIAFSL